VTPAQTAEPATSTPSLTATPSPPGGYPVIRVVGDLPFPADVTFLDTTGGYAHGTGTPWRTRLIVGAVEGPRVFEMTAPGTEDSVLMGILADSSSTLYAAVCSGPECGYEGPVTGATTTFYTSDDGGFRWTKINTRDGRWWPRLAVPGDLIAVNFDGPTGAAVFVTSNAAIERPDAWSGLVLYQDQPAWISPDFPMLVGERGESRFKFEGLPPEAKVSAYFGVSGSSRFAVAWSTSTPNAQSHGFDSRYFITSWSQGKVTTYETLAPFFAIQGPWGPDKWLVSAEVSMRPNTCTKDYARDGDHGLSPAVFDPATGDISFVGAPFFPDGCAEGAETIVAVWNGPTLAVHTPGDCLNLREIPSPAAKSLDCLPDGAIVLTNGPITESGGTRWASVTTLGATTGWMAEDFLASP
jgi:hypothetical protein